MLRWGNGSSRVAAGEGEKKARWEFALGRMSDRSLYVQRKEKEIWTMIRNETNIFNNDAQHLYRIYADKVVSLEGKLLARMRVTEKSPYGQVVAVAEK
jgi:hypothetical protein